jgi:glutamine phosphoribosylpyrophosphate amidotransferase
MRFMSSCDSELIAVYLANKIRDGKELEEAMQSSLLDLDGVFTYMVATKDKLGMAKDHMAAKPMVLYESDELVALASEEVAIRSLLPHEIDTYDPYEGEVKVWQA